MAGLAGWYHPQAAGSTACTKWLTGLGAAADSALGMTTLAGPGAVRVWRQHGLEVSLLGRARWQGRPAEQAALEALALSFRRDGADFLTGLRGQFLVCVLDHQHARGLVAIDRVGSYPLAHARHRDALVFGTDARDVARHPAIRATVSTQAVFSYLYAQMVPSPDTVFDGVAKLEPGQYLDFGADGARVGTYWRMPYEDGRGARFGERAETFHRLLRQGVARCTDETPCGSFLSGGTDSSTVSGLLSRLSGRPAQAYSIGFDVPGFDETEYARIAARHFGCDLHEHYVTPAEVCAAIPRVAAAYDEPFGNASAVPALICAQRAAQDGIAVLLGGDGGDEIFGGNARYAKQKVFELYWRLPAGLRRDLIEPLVLRAPFLAHGPLAKLRSYVDQARVPLPDRLETYNFLEREALDAVFTPDFLAGVDPLRPVEIARRAYAEAPAGQAVNAMMHLDLKQTLADNDLRKVVRMCELAGVEVRFPLLDDDLVEFAAGLPEHWKVRRMRLRWFFKEALKDFLPREILTKSKHGFGLPFGLWMTTDPGLQALAHDSLQQLKRRRILQPAYLEQLLVRHRSGHASYYGVMIWILMMLEQWLQANAAGFDAGAGR
jgi:asparagine synthase (glutamine-hydrolysing)